MERILYAVVTYENLRQGTLKPFITLTQNSSDYRSGRPSNASCWNILLSSKPDRGHFSVKLLSVRGPFEPTGGPFHRAAFLPPLTSPRRSW
jgi:hypothetical protein